MIGANGLEMGKGKCYSGFGVRIYQFITVKFSVTGDLLEA